MNISSITYSDEVKNIPGVNVTSCIVPCTNDDKYATHDSTYGKGGWREVDTVADRDAIPMERRKVGMAVRVTSINKTYILKYSTNNYCWYEENPTDVSSIINDAISQGAINIDLTGCVSQDQLSDALVPYMKSSVCESALSNLENVIKIWVNEQNFLTEHQSLENYATKEEVQEEFSSVNTELDNIHENISNIENDIIEIREAHSTYMGLTDTEIDRIKDNIIELQEAIGGGEEQSFATKDELQELAEKEQNDINLIANDINTIAEAYLTKTEANRVYATQDNLTSTANSLRILLNGYVRSTDLNQIIDSMNLVNKNYLRGYATEFYVQDYVAAAMAGRIKPGQSLVDYSTEIEQLKAQVADLTERLNNLSN